MTVSEKPIHLAFKDESDIIFRYQKKLHYLNTSTKFFKKLNSLKFLPLYAFIFFIFPITGLVLISSFFKKDFNPPIMYKDSSLELFIITSLYSLPFPAMIYICLEKWGYNIHTVFKIHVIFIICGIIFIYLIHNFLLQIHKFYLNHLIGTISKRRNNEFTSFFSKLNKRHFFSINKKTFANSNSFFEGLFYSFYKNKYSEDKHLFIKSNYINHIHHLNSSKNLFISCLRNKRKYLYINYQFTSLSHNEMTELIINLEKFLSNHYMVPNLSNLLDDYLIPKIRAYDLSLRLNKDQDYRVKKKI